MQSSLTEASSAAVCFCFSLLLHYAIHSTRNCSVVLLLQPLLHFILNSRCRLVCQTFTPVAVLYCTLLRWFLYWRPLLSLQPCTADLYSMCCLVMQPLLSLQPCTVDIYSGCNLVLQTCKPLLSLQPCTVDIYSHCSLVRQTFTLITALYCRPLLPLQPCTADLYSRCSLVLQTFTLVADV